MRTKTCLQKGAYRPRGGLARRVRVVHPRDERRLVEVDLGAAVVRVVPLAHGEVVEEEGVGDEPRGGWGRRHRGGGVGAAGWAGGRNEGSGGDDATGAREASEGRGECEGGARDGARLHRRGRECVPERHGDRPSVLVRPAQRSVPTETHFSAGPASRCVHRAHTSPRASSKGGARTTPGTREAPSACAREALNRSRARPRL